MARPYQELRSLLVKNDMSQADLADMLGVGERHVWAKLNARRPWSLDEMYAIMDRFEIPDERLHEIFSRGGKNEYVKMVVNSRQRSPEEIVAYITRLFRQLDNTGQKCLLAALKGFY